ncbi:hypothetical protein DCAR_0416645 [Daucus carota subsp. sativus]|uniref:Protein kinase domain-containing protein n=2 Tax=Daucus carota subsp. sativus TaxID=79200 RepID=A0AAF1AYR2_DAUCS|nr:hypothetical protein DCAR_0416645 [Daucus carota subsp. sativus]
MVVLVLMLLTIVAGAEKNCSVSRCPGRDWPDIHFPFWQKPKSSTSQPADDCAHLPDFQLSCGASPARRGEDQSSKEETLLDFHHIVHTSIQGLDLSFKYKAVVTWIIHSSQVLFIDTPILIDIVPSSVLANSSSAFHHLPLKTYTSDSLSFCYLSLGCRNDGYELFNDDPFISYNCHNSYTFFNCSSSSPVNEHNGNKVINSLSTRAFKVYAYSSHIAAIDMLDQVRSCTKMFDISTKLNQSSQSCEFDTLVRYREYPLLSWSTKVGGGKCEAERQSCKTYDERDRGSPRKSYADVPQPQPSTRDSGRAIAKLLIAVLLPCIFLVVLGLIFWYNFIRLNKQREEEEELKIKMFMENYKALKPTRYSYSDIKKITNMFKHKLGQGGYGSVFKGQISADIPVAVKVLHIDSRANGDDFINEVGTIGKIHHINVVRLLGYCADGCHRALVYEFQPNHSLEKFVYRRGKPQNFIGWKKMQKIARGIAKGMEYLHHGCAQQILHFDIKPNNILLDKNFNPKIADFGLAKLCNKGQSMVSMTAARGTIGYIAPEVFSRNFGKVSSKSDVYSFGMLLLEMVGGKTNDMTTEQNASDVYFPEWIFRRLEKNEELVIQIENEDDSKIARKLTIVGLWCIGWHPIDRPSMKVVIQMLEADECPAMPPNPFSTPTSGNATHAKSLFGERLQVISETE